MISSLNRKAKEMLSTRKRKKKRNDNKKKPISASLLGSYSFCPRSAWFTYNGISAKYTSGGRQRLEEGTRAHRNFGDNMRIQIRTSRFRSNLEAFVLVLAILGVILWTLVL